VTNKRRAADFVPPAAKRHYLESSTRYVLKVSDVLRNDNAVVLAFYPKDKTGL